jgi:hypothetical protein
MRKWIFALVVWGGSAIAGGCGGSQPGDSVPGADTLLSLVNPPSVVGDGCTVDVFPFNDFVDINYRDFTARTDATTEEVEKVCDVSFEVSGATGQRLVINRFEFEGSTRVAPDGKSGLDIEVIVVSEDIGEHELEFEGGTIEAFAATLDIENEQGGCASTAVIEVNTTLSAERAEDDPSAQTEISLDDAVAGFLRIDVAVQICDKDED